MRVRLPIAVARTVTSPAVEAWSAVTRTAPRSAGDTVTTEATAHVVRQALSPSALGGVRSSIVTAGGTPVGHEIDGDLVPFTPSAAPGAPGARRVEGAA